MILRISASRFPSVVLSARVTIIKLTFLIRGWQVHILSLSAFKTVDTGLPMLYRGKDVFMSKGGILQTRSNLSKIVNKVMKGDEHIIMRKNKPIAKIVPIEDNFDAQELIRKTLEIRKSAKSVTLDELNAWKKEGRE